MVNCPTCGRDSTVTYRCEHCGKDLVDDEQAGDRR